MRNKPKEVFGQPSFLTGTDPMKTISACFFIFLLLSSAVYADVAAVKEIINGNALKLSNGRTVRLIGVEIPSLKDHARNKEVAERLGVHLEHYEAFAERAKDFLEAQIMGDPFRRIWLTLDKEHTGTQYGDAAEGALGSVYYPTPPPFRYVKKPDVYALTHKDTRVFLNATLLKSGYGSVPPDLSFKRQDAFTRLAQEAKEKKRGIWQF